MKLCMQENQSILARKELKQINQRKHKLKLT